MLTSLSEDFGRTQRRGQATPMDVAYSKLQEFIENINDRIFNRLQLVQQVYLQDYKDQIKIMSEELVTLRNNFDSEMLAQRANDKMVVLEDERDFFRAQVMKLNNEVNQLLAINKELKKKVGDLKNQVDNFKAIAFNYENKILKLQKERKEMTVFKRQASAPVLPRNIVKEESEQQDLKQSSFNHSQREVSSHVNLGQRNKLAQTMRTKTYSKVESATKASVKKYQVFNGREHFIDQCIKQIKKQIFYRKNQQQGEIVHFDEAERISFDKFTRTDKKNLILKIMTNQKLLEEFNQFLFIKNGQNSASRMLRTKIGDDKFNQRFLSDLKRSFSKKIYDLKANQQVRSGQKQHRF